MYLSMKICKCQSAQERSNRTAGQKNIHLLISGANITCFSFLPHTKMTSAIRVKSWGTRCVRFSHPQELRSHIFVIFFCVMHNGLQERMTTRSLVQHKMIPAGFTSASVQASSDLCCKCHFDLSLGTTLKISIVAFCQFSVPSDQ